MPSKRIEVGMEAYELTPETIIDWATNHASHEDLERTAKAVYSVFKIEQREKYPDKYKAAKAYKAKHKSHVSNIIGKTPLTRKAKQWKKI